MEAWEAFEIACTDYLNNTFGLYATFQHQGGANSTVPDILVETKNNSFYIEAKCAPAQCGQFVLFPNLSTSKFDYSNKNTSRLNYYSQTIIDYMNSEFDDFRDAGTAGRTLHFSGDNSTFANWIIETYKEKGVEFFITNDYSLIPIEEIGNTFHITAKYRIKRSGSSPVGKSRFTLIENYLKTKNYEITNIVFDGQKILVESHRRDLHGKRFILENYEYMFSQRGSHFEIRKLSNTYNANVIFSITLKSTSSQISNEDFVHFLEVR